MGENRVCVSTSVKDSFFDDPFFSDWWKDFDAPMQQTYDKAFQRQISGNNRVTHVVVDNLLFTIL